MKIKTADLIDAPLDWAVAKAQGREEIRVFGRTRPSDHGWIEIRFNPDPRADTARFDPSTNWFQGGPIIEREAIGIGCLGKSAIYANPWLAARTEDSTEYAGPTPLIAAMRCFVASKLGDEVDIPEVLK